MSTIRSSLTYLDKSIFCFYYFFFRIANNFRIFDSPYCSFCSNLTWFYNLVFTWFKVFWFFYLIFKWYFFYVFNFTVSRAFANFDNFVNRCLCFFWIRNICYLWIFNGNCVFFFTVYTFLKNFVFTFWKFWIYSYFYFKRLFTCISVSAVSLSRANFYNSCYRFFSCFVFTNN